MNMSNDELFEYSRLFDSDPFYLYLYLFMTFMIIYDLLFIITDILLIIDKTESELVICYFLCAGSIDSIVLHRFALGFIYPPGFHIIVNLIVWSRAVVVKNSTKTAIRPVVKAGVEHSVAYLVVLLPPEVLVVQRVVLIQLLQIVC